MRKLLALLATLFLCLPAAQAREPYAEAELDQLLAPIALYPDALLSQVLMAATYPLEVVEAARWSRAHAGLVGDEAVRTGADQDWDPSVTSLLAFPHLLGRMDEQLDWTRGLGEAFLAQEADVMEAVQRLRQRAHAAGHLLGDERVRVIDDGGTLVIEYADPRVVYVPYYDPWVVYGGWGWPGYPPVAWVPWPGYGYVRSGLWWGTGIGVTVGFFFAAVDWPHRHVKVVHVHNHYVRRHAVAHAHRPIHVGRWQHYRDARPHRHHERPAFVVRPNPPSHVDIRQPHRDAWRHDRHAYPGRPAGVIPPRELPRPILRPHRPMPPALSTSPPPRRHGDSQIRRGPTRAVPYDRPHGRPGRAVDRADRGRGARADAAQHRAAQPYGLARHPRRDAGPVSVRPPVRLGVAGDRPRMGR